MQSITGKTKEGGTTKYINREGGKFNLTINGTTTSYENFGDFIIQSRAFTTNVANRRGSFGSKITNFERLSIDTNIRDTSKDVNANNTNVTDLVNDAVNKAAKSKKNTVAIKTSDVLEAAGVEQKQIDVLTGKTTGVPIVTTEIEYDKNSSTEDDSITNAYYSPRDKKIHLTAKGAFSMNASPRNAIRLLLHENIHKHFHNGRNYSKKQRERIIDELKEVYEYTLEKLANDKANGVIGEQLYNGIIEVFNIATKNKDDVVAMEEFLTECLTQPVLIEYLNNTKYKESVNIDGIPQKSKSILQKIMDILLDLFGINADRIKNNSILAREYAILSKTNSRTDAGLFAKEDSGLSEKTKSDNVKLPVEGTSKSKSAPSPVTSSSASASKEQTTNKKLKAIEDRINNMRNGFSERIVRSENFEEDHTYYLDGEKVDTSVTEAVHGKRDLEEWGLPASALGNSADGTARTYFQYNGAIPDNYVVPNATPEQRRRFIENLDALKEYLDNRFGIGKYKVITDEFPIGGVIHTAKGDVTVAGTMDMLVFDETGSLYIFDFKTKRDSGTGSDLSDYTKEGYDQQVNIYRQLIEANYPEFKGKVHIGGLIKFAVEYPKPTKDNYRMSPDKKGQLQYRPYPDMDYADIQTATNEYEFPYFYSDESVESQILPVEVKNYKDTISALPKKKVNETDTTNDATNDDIINDINAILDDMYDEDISDIDTDDLNVDDLNANTNLIEDETNDIFDDIYKDYLSNVNIDDVNDMFANATIDGMPNYTDEEQHILNTAKRNKEGKLLAPNGKVSNLTEKQYAQVRTKAFKKWFGDWENNPSEASKVVDENGEPLVVYHGSDSGIINDTIDLSKSDDGISFFATKHKEIADSYMENYDNIIENILFNCHSEEEIQKLFQDAINYWKENDTAYDEIFNPVTYIEHRNVKSNVDITEIYGRNPKTNKEEIGKKYTQTIEFDIHISAGYNVPKGQQEVYDLTKEELQKIKTEDLDKHVVLKPTTYTTVIDDDAIDSVLKKQKIQKQYSIFESIKNPLIIDSEYSYNWDKVPFENKTFTTRQISKIAKERGYDGVIFNNIIDDGGKNDTWNNRAATAEYEIYKGDHYETVYRYDTSVYVIFNPNQVKSATDNIGTFFRTDDNIYHADTNLLTATEIYANPIADGATDNAYGVRLVNDMDSFVRSFPEQYRGDIEHLMARDEIEYSCM